jgi:micrococcal nuclease
VNLRILMVPILIAAIVAVAIAIPLYFPSDDNRDTTQTSTRTNSSTTNTTTNSTSITTTIEDSQDINQTPVCRGSAKCFSGIVTEIFDGDTLKVDNTVIRLALSNTPEKGESGYVEATDFTRSLCPEGSTATVDEDDGQTEGNNGRMLALVYCGEINLNAELIYSGHATIWKTYCSESEFAEDNWAKTGGC